MNALASAREPKRSGNTGANFIVLNWASENGLMLLCLSGGLFQAFGVGCRNLLADGCGEEVAVDLAGEVALEAAHDLGFRLAFGGPPCDVGLGGLVPVHSGDDGAMQGCVGLAIPAAVEPVTGGLSGGGWNRVGAAECSEGGFAA